MNMKMKIASVLATLTLATGLVAQERPTEVLPSQSKVWKETDQKIKSNYTYIQLETSSIDPNDTYPIPALAIGTRFASHGASALDISVSAGYRDSDDQTIAHYHLPKLMYVHYVSPEKNNSLYLGAGSSWMGIYRDSKMHIAATDVDGDEDVSTVQVSHDHKFWGVAANANIGYEFGRNDAVRRMVQLDVSQPFLSTIQDGDFPKTPIIELSFGLGF